MVYNKRLSSNTMFTTDNSDPRHNVFQLSCILCSYLNYEINEIKRTEMPANLLNQINRNILYTIDHLRIICGLSKSTEFPPPTLLTTSMYDCYRWRVGEMAV